MIEQLRNYGKLWEPCEDTERSHILEGAANAIETMLKEREALIRELEHNCYNCFYQGQERDSGVCWDCITGPDFGYAKTQYKNWKWHGIEG